MPDICPPSLQEESLPAESTLTTETQERSRLPGLLIEVNRITGGTSSSQIYSVLWFLFRSYLVYRYSRRPGGQKKVLDLLKLKLQAILNVMLWVLYTNLGIL